MKKFFIGLWEVVRVLLGYLILIALASLFFTVIGDSIPGHISQFPELDFWFWRILIFGGIGLFILYDFLVDKNII